MHWPDVSPAMPRVDDDSLVEIEGGPWAACRLDAMLPLGLAHRLRQRLPGDELEGFISRALLDAVRRARREDTEAELMAPVSVSAVLPVAVLDWMTSTFAVPFALEQFVSSAIVAAVKGGAL